MAPTYQCVETLLWHVNTPQTCLQQKSLAKAVQCTQEVAKCLCLSAQHFLHILVGTVESQLPQNPMADAHWSNARFFEVHTHESGISYSKDLVETSLTTYLA